VNQLWLMEIGKAPQALTNDTYYKEDPAWSPDGAKIAYSSDKAGTEDIYILDVATKSEKRVTSTPDAAEFAAAWSPDGKSLAYQDQTGATYTLDLATGQRKKLIPSQFEPGKPSWGGNGKTVSVAAVKAYTKRFREGTSQILSADVATGALTFSEVAPFKSLSTGEKMVRFIRPIRRPWRSSWKVFFGSGQWTRTAFLQVRQGRSRTKPPTRQPGAETRSTYCIFRTVNCVGWGWMGRRRKPSHSNSPRSWKSRVEIR